MMKFVAIIMALLFVGAILPTDAKITAIDVAWAKAVLPGMEILINDSEVVSAAANNPYISMVQIACNKTKEDIISAKAINQAMPVSRDMQPAKDDYTSGLSSLWAGMDNVSTGYATGDHAKIKLGGSEIKMCDVYFGKINTDIGIAKAT